MKISRLKILLPLILLMLAILVLGPFRRKIYVSSSSSAIDARSSNSEVKIKAYRSLDGEILLDVQAADLRMLYLIVYTSQLILIPSYNYIVQVSGLIVSKEPKLDGVSLHKAEIFEEPIWSAKSVKFTGSGGLKIEVHW